MLIKNTSLPGKNTSFKSEAGQIIQSFYIFEKVRLKVTTLTLLPHERNMYFADIDIHVTNNLDDTSRWNMFHYACIMLHENWSGINTK